MAWDKVAKKEGCIYCQEKDTWCAFVNQKTGGCSRGGCVSKEEQKPWKTKTEE